MISKTSTVFQKSHEGEVHLKLNQIARIINSKTIKTAIRSEDDSPNRKEWQYKSTLVLHHWLTITFSRWLLKWIPEEKQKHNFPLIHERNNLKLSTSVAFVTVAYTFLQKTMSSWHQLVLLPVYCLVPGFLLACIAINCQVVGYKGRSLLCSFLNEFEDANIRLLTLNWQTQVTVSPILKHSPSNLQVLVSQRKRSFSLSS